MENLTNQPQKVKVVKPSTILSIEIGGTEHEILKSMMFEILTENLNIQDLETAHADVKKLDSELAKAVETDENLPFWKYKYLALANVTGRFEAICQKEKLYDEKTLEELVSDPDQSM